MEGSLIGTGVRWPALLLDVSSVNKVSAAPNINLSSDQSLLVCLVDSRSETLTFKKKKAISWTKEGSHFEFSEEQNSDSPSPT